MQRGKLAGWTNALTGADHQTDTHVCRHTTTTKSCVCDPKNPRDVSKESDNKQSVSLAGFPTQHVDLAAMTVISATHTLRFLLMQYVGLRIVSLCQYNISSNIYLTTF